MFSSSCCSQLQTNVSLHCRRNGLCLGNRYGRGSGPIWLDNLHCTGTESQLASCRHNGWGTHNCGHHEDVSIQCLDDSISTPSITTTVPGILTASNGNKPVSFSNLLSYLGYSLANLLITHAGCKTVSHVCLSVCLFVFLSVCLSVCPGSKRKTA